MPEVEGVNSSSAVVSWPKANNIPPGLEAHYYYVVWLQVDGATKRNVTQIVHHVGNYRFQSLIVGLVFNTHYSVKVEPYRQHQDKHEGGPATGVTSFKTSCIGRMSNTFKLIKHNHLQLQSSTSRQRQKPLLNFIS